MQNEDGARKMAADLNELIPEFRANVTRGLAALAGEGLPFKPYFTLRDPVKQAGFWRQSRSKAVVDDKLQELTGLGCDFIVACFEKAGSQNGPRVTGALPGESWHQWGEAVDCFLEDAAGNAIWESPKYARFGTVGDSNGMWWGGHFNDNDHWQHRRVEPPDVFGNIKRINDALRDRWGDAHSIQPAAALAPAGSGYRPDPSITGLLGGFAGSIPTVNPNRQAFVHPPRFLGEVQSP